MKNVLSLVILFALLFSIAVTPTLAFAASVGWTIPQGPGGGGRGPGGRRNPPIIVFPIPQQPAPTQEPPSKSGDTFTFRELTGTRIYIYQVCVNNKFLDFFLFGDDGKIAFMEKFDFGRDGKYQLIIYIWASRNDLAPVYTAEALDILEGHGFTSVLIRGGKNEIVYTITELREALDK